MENNRTEILQELQADLASLKEQLRALEQRLDALLQAPAEDLPAEESDFTGIVLGAAEPEAEIPDQVGNDGEEIPEQVGNDGAEPEPEPEVVPEPEAVPEPEPEAVPEPEPQPEAEEVPEVMVMRSERVAETDKLPWRLDKPGLSVKHIRSGISMYDRALFIGTLFKEDYALYDRTIGELDALTSLDEAVEYLLDRFPDWNLKSDIVYNFMMAIRKKLG